MTVEQSEHARAVRAWMERAAGLPTEALLRAFEAGFAALWRRADRTLGDVTLAAIMDRVLVTAADGYPVLAALDIGPTGIRWQQLRERAGEVHRDELSDGLCFVMIEFLTVLGNLTAEILSSALHAELARVGNATGSGEESEA
jgi:hypothetical protein